MTAKAARVAHSNGSDATDGAGVRGPGRGERDYPEQVPQAARSPGPEGRQARLLREGDVQSPRARGRDVPRATGDGQVAPDRPPAPVESALPPLFRDGCPQHARSHHDRLCAVEPLPRTVLHLQEAAEAGVVIILAIQPAKLKGFDEISKWLKGSMNGLLLSAQGSLNVFSVASMKEYPAFGDGLLFTDGNYEKIKLPR